MDLQRAAGIPWKFQLIAPCPIIGRRDRYLNVRYELIASQRVFQISERKRAFAEDPGAPPV